MTKHCFCILIFISLLLFVKCREKARTLSHAEYIDLLLDLQLAEKIISKSALENKDSMRKAYQLRICEIYGFKSREELDASMAPLQTDTELLLEITKKMNAKLDALSDSLMYQPDSLQ